MPYLVQINESGSVVKSWHLDEERLTFGRGETANETIDDQELSREHFAITKVGTNHVITDLKSTNGTLVNGRPINTQDLRGNEQIRAGSTRFLYQVGTATMMGLAEDAMGESFKNQLQDIYKQVKK